jgi:hypothetical protein
MHEKLYNSMVFIENINIYSLRYIHFYNKFSNLLIKHEKLQTSPIFQLFIPLGTRGAE